MSAHSAQHKHARLRMTAEMRRDRAPCIRRQVGQTNQTKGIGAAGAAVSMALAKGTRASGALQLMVSDRSRSRAAAPWTWGPMSPS